MFLGFLVFLRRGGIKVSLHDWLSLMEGLSMGLHGQSFRGFYVLSRALLVKTESDLDKYEELFCRYFRNVDSDAFKEEISVIKEQPELVKNALAGYIQKNKPDAAFVSDRIDELLALYDEENSEIQAFGAEYDEMMEMIDEYKDKFESVAVAEPLLGEVGADAAVINADKEAVAKAVTAAAVKDAGFDSLDAAAEEKVAFVFMGHGTSHTAKVSYSQMQTAMQTLGYSNVFIGTVEGEPEETACENVIEAVKAAGYTKVILRPLMVVAGDHANNDMAGADDDSWLSQFQASGDFASVECQIAGLGEIEDIQQRYIEHTKAAIDSLNG